MGSTSVSVSRLAVLWSPAISDRRTEYLKDTADHIGHFQQLPSVSKMFLVTSNVFAGPHACGDGQHLCQ
jgi:hypothetical protein